MASKLGIILWLISDSFAFIPLFQGFPILRPAPMFHESVCIDPELCVTCRDRLLGLVWEMVNLLKGVSPLLLLVGDYPKEAERNPSIWGC